MNHQEGRIREYYLGKKFNPDQLRTPSEQAVLGGDFNLSPRDLLTHAIILGMTGSGKSVLGKVIMEEAALQGIPSILIDPKGDLASLSLVFPSLKSEDFVPWIDSGREDKYEKAQELSGLYTERLASFGITKERLYEFTEKTRVIILTPRSTTGIPLAVSSLPSPPANVQSMIENEPETILELIDTIIRSLMLRLFPGDLPQKHRVEEKFLNDIVRYAWKNQIPFEGIDGLAKLVELVENPPMKKIGVMDVDSYISSRERHELAVNINNLLVGVEQLWHIGISLDIDLILDLYSRDGKTPIIIISLNELSSFEDKIFVVSRIAYSIYEWMRRKGSSGEPRLIFYVDEIGGGGGKTAFFPIHPYNTPSKPPLMLLIKQARAFGVCCVFSTQNPGDIDYKGLSNCGTWIIGRLSTARDREKVLQGVGDIELFGTSLNRKKLEKQIASLRTGEFICKAKTGDIEFFKERWLMSFHKTMTSRDIKEITNETERRNALTITPIHTEKAALKLNHPPSPEEIRSHFEGIKVNVETTQITYLPILLFKLETEYKKKHPLLSKELKAQLEHDPLMVPLFKDQVDTDYIPYILKLKEISKNDLQKEPPASQTTIASERLSPQDVLSGIPPKVKKEIEKEILEKLEQQIQEEKETTLQRIRTDFKPQLDEIDFELKKLKDQATDIQGQINQITEEISNLQSEREGRTKRGEPVIMVTKGLNSRIKKKAWYDEAILKLQNRTESVNAKKRQIIDSETRKLELIEDQFKTLEKEIHEQTSLKLSFKEATEVLVPLCSAVVSAKDIPNGKTIKIEWNGYNGSRTNSFRCSTCGTDIEDKLRLCHLYLETLCREHTLLCKECGKTICRNHSWTCQCPETHCTNEEQTKCKDCETLLCNKCRQRCEACGSPLCSNHIHSCKLCKRSLCKEHAWTCESCSKTFCNEEKKNYCSIGQHLLCEDCRLTCEICKQNICKKHSTKCSSCNKILCQRPDHYKTCSKCGNLICNSCLITCQGCQKPLCTNHTKKCPNCGSQVCESCLKTESKFLGLSKKQKCVACIER